MTEQTIPEVDRQSLNASFDHAMRMLLDTQRSINAMGVPAPALASALCASYVTYVAALVASIGLPKEEVATTCKSAIDTMGEFINLAYERMTKEIAQAEQETK